MSFITFNSNDIVYIKGIGYGTLIDCGSKQTLKQRVPQLSIKKSSMHFDPDLFNSDADSNRSKKSQGKSDEQKLQAKVITDIKPELKENTREGNMEGQEIDRSDSSNIVKAKLEGTNAFIFTQERNLSKSIIISIRSLLANHRQQINFQIDFSKTIDTFKKTIFEQIGQNIAQYSRVKIFATNPKLIQLNVLTKTLHQYRIKENDKLILVADHTFSFRPLPTTLNCQFKITLNNNTLTSCTKPLPEPKLPAVIPLPPVLPSVEGEPKVENPREQLKMQTKDSDVTPALMTNEEKTIIEHPTYISLCNTSLPSGKRYWEVKVDKVPIDENELIIGVCLPSSNIKDSIEGCSNVWAYYAVSGKKGYEQYDENGNQLEEWQQQYGYAVKPNDIIGVLAIVKTKSASITFYKNSICCGQAFDIDLSQFQERSLVPFVNIGGECQVVLDSRASLPLDAYRR